MDDDKKPDDASSHAPFKDPDGWSSRKLWYSIVLQIVSTVLLQHRDLTGEQWIWVTGMIYCGYIIGNIGQLAVIATSIGRRE